MQNDLLLKCDQACSGDGQWGQQLGGNRVEVEWCTVVAVGALGV